MKKRNELQLTLFFEKMGKRYSNKELGMSKITFDDLYNNSDIILDLQEKHNFNNLSDLIKVFDIIVNDFRFQLDYDYTLTFEEYYKSLL